MAETYLEITQQIEALKQKAETVRESEIAGVIERIRAAIKAYGLTADQLFDAAPERRAPSVADKPAGRSSARRSGGPRFRDDAGNSWSGRGPRPRWLKTALAAGRSIDEFAVGDGARDANGSARRRAAGAPSAPPKYKDGEGHSWSGRGPRPGWVKAALEAGKTLDELT